MFGARLRRASMAADVPGPVGAAPPADAIAVIVNRMGMDKGVYLLYRLRYCLGKRNRRVRFI